MLFFAATSPARAEENASSQQTLTGDWGGIRGIAEERGFRFSAVYIGETASNLTGGIRRGTVYEGRLELQGRVNLERVLGWTDTILFANAWVTHGRGLSANYAGNLAPVSSIETDRGARLANLWLQRSFDGGRFSFRIGQLAADDEFFTSETATAFVNSTFGWPIILGADLPGGGPVFPLATPGVRVKGALSDRFSVQAAVLNGDPSGAGFGPSSDGDRSGLAFRLNFDAFLLLEGIYEAGREKETALPLVLKFGAWLHSGRFPDQRSDVAGRSLADPASTGEAAGRRGNAGLYFVADRMFWRDAQDRSISAFVRLAGAPQDRNLLAGYIDAGLTYRGIRDGDLLGFAVSYARVGDRARALDGDFRRFTGVNRARRDDETVLEATYLARLSPWWSLQPDAQFIRHPAAHAATPTDPTGRTALRNAFLLALRTTVTF